VTHILCCISRISHILLLLMLVTWKNSGNGAKSCDESSRFTCAVEVFFESHPVYDQTQGSGAVFFLL
jgi:hypothetical protein